MKYGMKCPLSPCFEGMMTRMMILLPLSQKVKGNGDLPSQGQGSITMYKQGLPPNEQGVPTKGQKGEIDVLILFIQTSLQTVPCVVKPEKGGIEDDIILR